MHSVLEVIPRSLLPVAVKDSAEFAVGNDKLVLPLAVFRQTRMQNFLLIHLEPCVTSFL